LRPANSANSANGGYVCGLLAGHIDGSAEITLRLPPPLSQQLGIVASADGAVELRENDRILATGRAVPLHVPEIPVVTFSEAKDAVRRTPYDESNHNVPMCFVCGPARAHGDGLRVFAGPWRRALMARPEFSRHPGSLTPIWRVTTVVLLPSSFGLY